MESQLLLHEESTKGPVEPSESRGFLANLLSTHRSSGATAEKEPSQESWLTYYGVCVEYISSLHNQFIATLSIQGALAIGCLAAIYSVPGSSGSRHLGPTLGTVGFAMELALTFIAVKLFRQHCVTCWMLARIERERLGLPEWAAMKGQLGSRGNRLFTSSGTLFLTIAYGLGLGAGLAAGSFVGP